MKAVEPPVIHFANFLSPLLQETYDELATYVGNKLTLPVTSGVSANLAELQSGQADIGFLCGLLYTRIQATGEHPVELLAAPVLQGARYQERPIYFSDVIVNRTSPFKNWADLRRSTWAYNEEASHSGYNLVQYSLLERQEDNHYFGKTIKSGAHLQSLQMVLTGQADATAIDSHILDVVLHRDPQIAAQIRIIDQFGPSSIPPVVAARHLPLEIKQAIQNLLSTAHEEPRLAQSLQAANIQRFVPVRDSQYDDIRHMYARVQGSGHPDHAIQTI
ncbi:PhnD/SsuA/transferrin family substrate-binding protein [Dictyobacter arantiisoli]|uniref:Phosphate ABC transporter substrate-binding protein n=1 Tax=Dictyobacter arantiisoli TaxID=2014874 RepID=A0A5A5T7H8_9CHLR|nr:PhnD/SsuA/transferrin family substrate-binding protein [Dictyobacter arantiisoli]GCF07430.1 hypothetical protein KDI_09940 [Dictyobacter arantiisoli]